LNPITPVQALDGLRFDDLVELPVGTKKGPPTRGNAKFDMPDQGDREQSNLSEAD
jgi:hypothetical protein